MDHWVGSRPIWNMHTYHVTNVETDGVVLPYSLTDRNWALAGLNNFRANTIGDLSPDASPDLTAGPVDLANCGVGAVMELEIRACNRGTVPVAPGVPATFYAGDPEAGGEPICTAWTTVQLDPGDCELIGCTWDPAPLNDPVDVFAVADDDGSGSGMNSECHEGNNGAFLGALSCGMMP
jgi:hypothetical protein